MGKTMTKKFLMGLAVMLLGTLGAVHAQDVQQDTQAPPPNTQNPPASGTAPATNTNPDVGVARISLIHGEVSTQRGDSGDWSAATVNQPVVAGDKVSTGNSGHAEVQLDYAHILRLGDQSQAKIATLSDNQVQVQVGQGMANFSTIRGGGNAQVEIDTPNVAVHPYGGEGSYRIVVNSDQETQVIVRQGEADVSTPQGSTHVTEGQLITVKGSMADAQYKVTDAPGRDDFDKWNADRDRTIHEANSWKHTDQYYTGSEDLDNNGVWTEVPDYGQVWVPNEPADWAPYRDGNWVWEPSWGWTWVGGESWGWAPYHYGRWFSYNNGWAWWPGPVNGGFYRPIWAPAYVSFFGFGGGIGFGVGFGFGSVGWFPIGPCDPFFPWWGAWGGRFGFFGFNDWGRWREFGGFGPLHGGDRFSNFRLAQNNGFRSGMSSVSRDNFGRSNARPESFRGGSLSNARMMSGNVPVAPTRASLSASGRAASPSTIRGNQSERFFGRTSSATTRSFSQEQGQVRQSIERSSGSAAGRDNAQSSSARSNSTAGDRPSTGTSARTNGSFGSDRSAANGTNQGAANTRGSTQTRSFEAQGSADRPPSARTSGGANADGYQRFTPQSDASSRGYGNSASRPAYGGSSRPSYGSSDPYRGYGGSGSSRPPLNMSRPIVTPRSSYGGYRGSSGGSSRGGSSGGSSRGSSSSGSHGSSGGHSSGGGHGGHGR